MSKMMLGFKTRDDVYDEFLMIMMLYTTDLITQQSGVDESHLQVEFIQNISAMPRIELDLARYQTTDDIWGLTLTGSRDPKEFDTTFILNNKIRLIPKESYKLRKTLLQGISPELNSIDNNASESDQIETLE
jgi:hypothetical protein